MTQSIDVINAKILIVDDQESNVQLLEQLLQAEGYSQVSATMRPQDVYALHQANAYDLILLDLQMPLMDGFQVMEALKTSTTDPYLPVIVLTAQPGHKLRALQAGAKDFVSKPFDLVEVKTRIRNMLEVRMLHKRLADFNKVLEQTVQERTAELRESEARYRSLTELAADWYWEQDEHGNFTKVCGPVAGLLGIQPATTDSTPTPLDDQGWDDADRQTLRAAIAAREPFLDFIVHRSTPSGKTESYRVSGEPMFSTRGRFTGYRGIGVETLSGT